MKKLLVFFIIIPFFTFSQTQTLKVELVDYAKEKTPAYCGIFLKWGILKFKVVENLENFYRGQIIYGQLTCPREIMESLFENKKYVEKGKYFIKIEKKTNSNKVYNKNAVNMFYGRIEKKEENIFSLLSLREFN